MTRCLAHLAIAALALTVPVTAAEEPSPGMEPGLFFPLRDLSGDPAMANMVEKSLLGLLARYHPVAAPTDLRTALRRLRIRDVNHAPPSLLDRLAAELGVGWFFSATLHRALATPVPQITLSARLYRTGQSNLAWAGFEAASGLDERGWLELGRVDELELVAFRTVKNLVRDFNQRSGRGRPADSPADPSRTGFLSERLASDSIATVAVIPFDAVTDLNPSGAAEMITDLTLAMLYRRGVEVVQPGLVREIQRRSGALLLGTVDPTTRGALRNDAGADGVLTGTVEIFSVRGDPFEPEPWIALGARLIETESGQILWIDGQERRGWDRQRLFHTGRVFSAGDLAEQMIDSLLEPLFASQRAEIGRMEP